MFKFNFKSISPNIYVPNHVSNYESMFNTHKIIIDNEHFIFYMEKMIQRKKLKLLGFKIKVKKVYIATQVNEPSSCCIWAFVNRHPIEFYCMPLLTYFTTTTYISIKKSIYEAFWG